MADQDQFNSQPGMSEPQRMPPSPPPIRPREPEPENLPFSTGGGFSAPVSGAPVAPPPAPEIAMRTMESDIRSVKGGAPAPVAESVLPSELRDVLEQPETVDQMGGAVESSSSKKIFKVILIVVLVSVLGGGLGFAGYKYVYPLFTPSKESAVVTPPKEEEPAIIQTRITHKTYFVGSIPKTTINFRDLSLVNLTQAFHQVSSETDRSLKEVEIFDPTGGQIYAKDFLANILPLTDADKTLLSENLDPDLTAYLYYDKSSAWPGSVFKLKTPNSAAALQQSFLPVVELMDLSVFYLNAPGIFQQFKDGKVDAFSTRYAVASQPGAAFNYGIFGEYLIFSASYDGLKAAVDALGL